MGFVVLSEGSSDGARRRQINITLIYELCAVVTTGIRFLGDQILKLHYNINCRGQNFVSGNALARPLCEHTILHLPG